MDKTEFVRIILGYMNSEPGTERREYFDEDITRLCKTFGIDRQSIMSRENAHEKLGVSNRLDAWDKIYHSMLSESDYTCMEFHALNLAMISISWEFCFLGENDEFE